jgi:hypothetical protein
VPPVAVQDANGSVSNIMIVNEIWPHVDIKTLTVIDQVVRLKQYLGRASETLDWIGRISQGLMDTTAEATTLKSTQFCMPRYFEAAMHWLLSHESTISAKKCQKRLPC